MRVHIPVALTPPGMRPSGVTTTHSWDSLKPYLGAREDEYISDIVITAHGIQVYYEKLPDDGTER